MALRLGGSRHGACMRCRPRDCRRMVAQSQLAHDVLAHLEAPRPPSAVALGTEPSPLQLGVLITSSSNSIHPFPDRPCCMGRAGSVDGVSFYNLWSHLGRAKKQSEVGYELDEEATDDDDDAGHNEDGDADGDEDGENDEDPIVDVTMMTGMKDDLQASSKRR